MRRKTTNSRVHGRQILQGCTQGQSRPPLCSSKMLVYFTSQFSFSSFSEEIFKHRLGTTNRDQMTKHCKVPQTETDKRRKQRFTAVIGYNCKLVPMQGKEKVVKKVKQQYSSVLRLSGRSVTRLLSTLVPIQHTFTLLEQKPLRQRGQAGTPGSKSSASPKTLVQSSHDALLQEH